MQTRLLSPRRRLHQPPDCLNEERELQSEKFYVERLRKQRQKMQQMKSQFDQISDRLIKKDEQISRLNNELEKAKRLQDFKLKYEQTVIVYQQLQLQFRQLIDHSLLMKSHIEHLEAQRFKYVKLQSLKQQNSKLNKQIEQAQFVCEQLEYSMQELNKAKKKQEKTASQQITRLKEQLDKMKSQNQELLQTLQLKLSQNQSLNKRMIIFEDQLANTRKLLIFERDQSIRRQNEFKATQDELIEIQKLLGKQQNEIECYKLHLSNSNQMLKKKKSEQILLKQNFVVKQNQIFSKSKQSLQRKQVQISFLKKENAELKSELIWNIDRNRKCQLLTLELDKENSLLRERIADMGKQITIQKRNSENLCKIKRQLQLKRHKQVDKIDELFNELVK